MNNKSSADVSSERSRCRLAPFCAPDPGAIDDYRLYIPGDMSGSLDRCKRLLRQLEESIAPKASKNGASYLELEVSGVLVSATIESDTSMPYLLISTLVSNRFPIAAPIEDHGRKAPVESDEFRKRWPYSGAESFMLMQKVGIDEFLDERHLLDAIVGAGQEASRWRELL